MAAIALLLAVFGSEPGRAAEVEFVVSPNSRLDLLLTIIAFELDEQGPGSLSTTYAGTITVDVDNLVSPTTIDFIGGAVTANNSGNWFPEPGGGPAAGQLGSSAPANYGVFEATGLLLVGDAYGAIRDIEIDVTTPDGPLTVTGGNEFPSTQMLEIATGWADINYEGGLADLDGDASRSDLTGSANNNAAAAPSSYARNGSVVTLTIPVDVDLPVTLAVGTGTANITGQLFASANLSTGDFDQDGDQDGRDYLRWQQGFGMLTGAMLEDGDGNFDGAVLGDDRALWESGYGDGAAVVPSVHPLPEPATFILLAVAAMLAVCWRP